MPGYVYILANRKNGTLYTGHTANIAARTWAHKAGVGSKFTTKYGLTKLVWCDFYEDIRDAAYRESQIKNWKRQWKINLIETDNPHWEDLSFKLNIN
ncbi:MAG: GIY-YIG nuclease family protein [Parvularculaceae bacterium]